MFSAINAAISSPAGALLGDVASSLFGRSSARSAATTAYNRQREMTEWVGRNQIQWKVDDMKKAGINPVLAVSGGFGGGGSPAVSQAHATDSGRFGSSAAQAAMFKSTIEYQKAQTALVAAQAQKTSAETAYIQGVQTPLGQAQTGSYSASAGQAAAETKRIEAATAKIVDEVELIREQTRGAIINNDTAQQLQALLVRLKELEVQAAAVTMPRKEAEGKAGAAVGSGLDAINRGTSAAGSYLGGKAADLRDWINGKLSEWESNARKRRGGK